MPERNMGSDRSVALLESKPFYFGRPCKRGHFLRDVKNCQCVICRRMYVPRHPRPGIKGRDANMKIVGFLSEMG